MSKSGRSSLPVASSIEQPTSPTSRGKPYGVCNHLGRVAEALFEIGGNRYVGRCDNVARVSQGLLACYFPVDSPERRRAGTTRSRQRSKSKSRKNARRAAIPSVRDDEYARGVLQRAQRVALSCWVVMVGSSPCRGGAAVTLYPYPAPRGRNPEVLCMRGSWRLALALLLAGAASNVSAAVCATSTSAAPRLERLTTAMAQGRFIAYTPSSMQLVNGKPARTDPNTIRADLQLLRPRFDSLVTYGALDGAEAIPAIAASLGFRALIIGVYDPFDATELNAALAAAHSQPTLVVGLALGNELLFFHHHDAGEFESLIESVHARAPQLPLATTEPFHALLRAGAISSARAHGLSSRECPSDFSAVVPLGLQQ